jgi:hypothetical protein
MCYALSRMRFKGLAMEKETNYNYTINLHPDSRGTYSSPKSRRVLAEELLKSLPFEPSDQGIIIPEIGCDYLRATIGPPHRCTLRSLIRGWLQR